MSNSYITYALRAVPNAAQWGTKSTVVHRWEDWIHLPGHLGGSRMLQSGRTKLTMTHNWVD